MTSGAALSKVIVVAGMAAGCLSGGPPPAGQKLAAGRDVRLIGALSSSPDEGRVLFARDAAGPYRSDLYIVSWSAAGGAPPAERLLLERMQPGTGLALDARGRLLVLQAQGDPGGDAVPEHPRLVRVDPQTGVSLDLGTSFGYQLSPLGTRLVLTTETGVELRDLDDRVVSLGAPEAISGYGFIGEDLYFSIRDGPVQRIASDGTRETITGPADAFSPYLFPTGPILILFRSDAQMNRHVALLDLATRIETALPMSSLISFSPAGTFVLGTIDPPARTQEAALPRYVLLDRRTGASQTFDLPTYLSLVDWRPGHDELWLSVVSSRDGGFADTFFILRPGQALVEVQRQLSFAVRNDGSIAFFILDGAYFFSSDLEAGASMLTQYVVPADDPTGMRIRLNPLGTNPNRVSSVPGGKLLVEASYVRFERSDLLLVDPATGAARTIGEAGSVVAIGSRRILARQHWADASGAELTLIDVERGDATTKLADAVIDVLVERGAPGDDFLGPGARVAYVLRNRIASPYDGLWLVTLP